MTTTKHQPRKAIAYSGDGSAVDNYLSPSPVEAKKEPNWQGFDIKNGKHKYILSMLHTMGWTKEVNNRAVGDMEAFGHWLQTKSPVKKPLLDMTPEETSKVVFAFEKVVKHQFS